MEFQIDVPDEIKPKIMQKITQNGTLKSIKRKVKIGMMIAVEEIKNNSESESYLERKIFKNADPYELKALQSIFNFLSANKMNYTLSTLLEESAVRRNSSEEININDLIDNEINHPEIPTNNYIIDEDTRYYEETHINSEKNKPNSHLNSSERSFSSENKGYDSLINSKKNNYDTNFDGYINHNDNLNQQNSKKNYDLAFNNNFKVEAYPIDSNPSSSNRGYFDIPLNSNGYNPKSKMNASLENVSKPNQELQGFSISRRTFERNQFVISVVNL